MKRYLALMLSAILFLLTACPAQGQPASSGITVDGYTQIDQETAKQMMSADDGHVIVDVRTQEEYAEGHIPDAICIPNESIGVDPPEQLPDFSQIILIYCRSGRRSKEAAQKLASIGYSDIYEFGGIIDWTGEVVTEDAEEMVITITAAGHVVTATLYDNAAGRALWDMLPLSLPMENLYSREMCYRFGAGSLPDSEAADAGYEVGDISYWPPAGSLVILYEQNGEVFEQQPIGHTDGDLSFFIGMEDTEVMFAKVTNADMTLAIDGTEVPVTWENNASVEVLKGLLPLTIQMSMYGGFEQVGPIGQSIARDDTQVTTSAGDIVLYSGDQIVIFYGSNTWAYTMLGHIDLPAEELAALLSNGNVTVLIEQMNSQE